MFELLRGPLGACTMCPENQADAMTACVRTTGAAHPTCVRGSAQQQYREKVHFCLSHHEICFTNLAERFCFGIANVLPVCFVLQCPDSDSVIKQAPGSQQKDSGKLCLEGHVYEIQDTGSAATTCMIGHICQQKIGDCCLRASHL